jgi:hypothetical protein
MTTPFDAPDWRSMSQQDRDLGLNNGLAVAGSAEIVAGWERRSADMRVRHASHLDLRYGPRQRNRIDFLKSSHGGPTLVFIHGGYWQGRAKEVFTAFADGPMAHGITSRCLVTRWPPMRRSTKSSPKSTGDSIIWSNDCRPSVAMRAGLSCPDGPPAGI